MKLSNVDFGESIGLNLSLEEEFEADEFKTLVKTLAGTSPQFSFKGRALLLFYQQQKKTACLELHAGSHLEQETLNRLFQAKDRAVVLVKDLKKKNVFLEIRLFTERKVYAAAPLDISLDNDFRLNAANEAGSIIKDLVKFMENEFLYDGHLFIQPNTKGEMNGRLIGNRYVCHVKYDIATASIRARNLKRKNRNAVEHMQEIRMIMGKIRFVDGISGLQTAAQQLYEEDFEKNKEFEDIWNAYNEAERAKAVDETNMVGAIAYTVVRDFPHMELRLASKMNFSGSNAFLQSSQGYAVCAQSDFEMARREAASDISTAEQAISEEIAIVSILDILKKNRKPVIFLCDAVTWNARKNVLDIDVDWENQQLDPIPLRGYIFASYNGSRTMIERRTHAYDDIQMQRAALPDLRTIIGSGKTLNHEIVKHKNIVNRKLLKKIFSSSDDLFTEKQIEAIDIAINTPDIALIQGPPGTGKTTIIRAIVERLHELYPEELRILISSTQHEAVDNAIRGMICGGLPPVRIQNGHSKSMRGDQQNKIAWLENLTEKCDELINEMPENRDLMKYRHVYQLLEEIRCHGCRNFEASRMRVQKLQEFLQALGYDEYIVDRVHQLESRFIEAGSEDDDKVEENSRLEALLAEQSITAKDFLENQGQHALIRLQTYLRFFDGTHADELLACVHADWTPLCLARKGRQRSEDIQQYFKAYREDVERLVTQIKHPIIAPAIEALEKELGMMLDEVKAYVDGLAGKERTLADVLWEFRDDISNPNGIERVLQQYSRVKAATCQQAAIRGMTHNGFIQQGSDVAYHYVIIDEAARSNPLDLLIPMARGAHIILVGDQRQLPHMLEKNITDRVLEHVDEADREHKKELLSESLFQRLFRQLKQADGLPRVTMLEDQYRMHPVIGEFVSDSFYDGKLRSPLPAEKRAHNLGLFDDKPVAWIDIPLSMGKESRDNFSYQRQAEAAHIKEIVRAIYAKNNHFSIGIITFYRAQVAAIISALSEFPRAQQELAVGTVDAFQGNEFDIVILSTVRSNTHLDHRRRVGFLDNPNRLCVAFSRAKRLLICVGDHETVAGTSEHPVIRSFEKFYELCRKEGYDA